MCNMMLLVADPMGAAKSQVHSRSTFWTEPPEGKYATHCKFGTS